MASVQNSKAKFYQRTPEAGEDAPHIESEADIFIKELSRKQLDPNVTLEQQLASKKEFHSCHIYQPENESLAGIVSLQRFKDVRANEEIRQGKEISDEDLQGSTHISRHVRELALAVKPNSVETKLLKFAISCNSISHIEPDIRPPNHPINQLHDIERDRFAYLSDESNPLRTAKTILRKRQQLLESISEPIEIKRKPVPSRGKSLWDVTETSTKSRNHLYSCAKQRSFTIRDQQIIELKNHRQLTDGENNSVEEDEIHEDCITQRLSEDEIKKLSKFSDYDKGTPSETLYLKNISLSVTEADLSSLFAKYQKPEQPRITYKLMKNGRMRGQGFVHCHCIESATAALEGVNGEFLHGKPIIIQFSSSEKKRVPVES